MGPDFLEACREVLLIAHLVSGHTEGGLNNRNPGVGIACRAYRISAAAGTYRNSFDRQSVYAVAGVDLVEGRGLRLGAIAGLASGYDHVQKLPMIGGARLTLQLGEMEIGVLGVPPVGRYVGFLHLTFGIRLR